MARGLGIPSRSFDVDLSGGLTSRSPQTSETGETGSPREAPGCPPRAPSTTEQGKLRGSPGGARATTSSSSTHPDQDQTLRAVMGRVDAMLTLFPSTRLVIPSTTSSDYNDRPFELQKAILCSLSIKADKSAKQYMSPFHSTVEEDDPTGLHC